MSARDVKGSVHPSEEVEVAEEEGSGAQSSGCVLDTVGTPSCTSTTGGENQCPRPLYLVVSPLSPYDFPPVERTSRQQC